MNRVIVGNFKLSVVITVIGCVFIFIAQSSSFPESLSHLGAYQNQALIWPAIVGFLSVFFWFIYYRQEEGHVPAFILGFMILIPAVSGSVSELINGPYFNESEKIFLYYSGLSHILYGLIERKSILSALGQNAN